MFGRVNYKEEVALNFSPSSPKLRLSIITYMLEARSLPRVVEDGRVRGMDADEFIAFADRVAKYVCEDNETFLAKLEAFTNADTVETPTDVAPPDPTNSSAYL